MQIATYTTILSIQEKKKFSQFEIPLASNHQKTVLRNLLLDIPNTDKIFFGGFCQYSN